MTASMSAEFLALQELLAGRYSIERELGRGGMGIVLLARDVALDRPVAIKLLPPHLATRPDERDRVLQEAAMLAERSDVEEEVTRLRTHIQHFHSLLQAGGEMGKKLDFLLQEMNREANTLLSKTGGVSGNGQRITDLGLGMKSEIEKAREQVQNLE